MKYECSGALARPSSMLLEGIRLLALTCALGVVSHSSAADAEFSAMEVVTRADRNNSNFVDYQVDAEMTLLNERGDTSLREMRISVLEVPDDGDKSLIVFQSPADQKGVALLSHGHVDGPDDQFLYLPAIKRVKRIASENRSGPFVGSEFAFEDIVRQEISEFEYESVGHEPCGELECFVVNRFPRDENSGYTVQRAWYDDKHFRVQKIDYYDRKNSLLKTLTIDDYRSYDGIWWAHTLVMENHQTGNKTRLEFAPYEFKTGLSSSDFAPSALRRIR